MRRSPRDRPAPKVGELIYGCQCRGSACGSIERVDEHVTADGMDHWKVKEHFNGRWVRVRRESDGNLYEVEITHAYD